MNLVAEADDKRWDGEIPLEDKSQYRDRDVQVAFNEAALATDPTSKTRNPRSLRICTLLSKPARREVEVPVDYTGFDIPDEFVVGYGLDFDEMYRNFPFIAVLKPAVFAHLLGK